MDLSFNAYLRSLGTALEHEEAPQYQPLGILAPV